VEKVEEVGEEAEMVVMGKLQVGGSSRVVVVIQLLVGAVVGVYFRAAAEGMP